MADVNADAVTSQGGCLVGQKMDKCVKSPDSTGGTVDQNEGQANLESGPCDSTKTDRTDDGTTTQEGERPLLRPSAFNPTPGQGMVGGPAISNNPFAVKPGYSDSDEEKKEKPIVSPAHFTPGGSFGSRGFGFGLSGGSKLLLKPSALDKQTANFNKENSRTCEFRTSFKLEPAKLKNPFLKTEPDKDDSPEKVAEKPSESVGTAAQHNLFGSASSSENIVSATNSKVEKNAFSPLTSATSSQNTSFLFGQNMQNRVFGSNLNSFTSNDGGFIFGQSLSERVTSVKSNGTAAGQSPKREETNNTETTTTSPESDKSVSLEESAAAHQARLARPEFEEVQVKTGEEDESNVFQINVKLFLFDKANQSWIEKGRGQLRLNDMSCTQSRSFQSRLVMRTQGSLRVVLNTKVWAGMLVEMASEKSVRITAVDHEDGIKIYLIMANRSDASHIYSAINSRVQQLRAQEQKDKSAEGTSSEKTRDTSDAEPTTQTHTEKRKSDTSSPEELPTKRTKTRHNVKSEESNDSSTVDPETEASNESCTSSPTVKSSSSD